MYHNKYIEYLSSSNVFNCIVSRKYNNVCQLRVLFEPYSCLLVDRCMQYVRGCVVRGRNCIPFGSTWIHPDVLVVSVPLIFLPFCVVLLCGFTFRVPCSDVHDDFRIKTMSGSTLPPVVCRRARVLFTLFVFVYV